VFRCDAQKWESCICLKYCTYIMTTGFYVSHLSVIQIFTQSLIVQILGLIGRSCVEIIQVLFSLLFFI